MEERVSVSTSEIPEDVPYIQADRALYKIAKLRLAKAKLQEWIGEEVRKIDGQESYWLEQLRLASEILSNRSGKSTVPLPNGRVTLRETKGKFKIDDAKAAESWAREWLQDNEAAINKMFKVVPPKLVESELRACLEASFSVNEDGRFLGENGEPLTFARVEGSGKSLSFSINPGIGE